MDTSTKVYTASTKTQTWTSEPTTIQWFIDNGATVKPARLHGDYTLWIDGHNMAALFISQAAQKEFLLKRGMI